MIRIIPLVIGSVFGAGRIEIVAASEADEIHRVEHTSARAGYLVLGKVRP